MKKVPLEKLVEDMEFYPRNEVSSQVVTALADALEAGESLPPIVLDSKTYRIVDGWHRYRAYRRLGYKDVMCDLKDYASDAEMFTAAVQLNAAHGRRLDTYDIKRSAARLQELGLEIEAIAPLVRMTPARLEEMVKGNATTNGHPVILKSGLHHLAGMKLSKNQQIGVEKASGMQATYHVNCLLNLLENNIAPHDEKFLAGMDKLAKLWREVKKKLVAV